MDRYRKVQDIGQGSFGSVYSAIDQQTGRKVAVKKIHVGERGSGASFTALREVKILQENKHPNVIEARRAFANLLRISDRSSCSQMAN
jgi:cyclin-dependent kinase 7